MGIQGLLPFLKKIHTQVNIAQFQGCTVAIDAYCWLHKGAFSCAEKLAMKEDTDQYVYYCMKYIDYMLKKDIKPILVFDGCHLESKAGVEKTRRERRELHRKKAAQFLREGKRIEAKECLQKCVDITPQMALKLIKVCRARGVDCIVAPYEADAQLAYLNLSGIAQIIVTEDSDLLLFGCEKIIFKMDFFGNGTMIEKSRLNEVMSVQSGFYTFEKFRHMSILSGCDYLPSLHGIGLAKANKVFKLARQGDIKQLLKKLPTYLKMNIAVSDEYVEGFIKADNTFLYQLVFDPLKRELKPLNPYLPELQGVDLKYAGHQISRHMAYQIALGNIDIHTREPMADFDPDTFVAKHPTKVKYRHLLSMWDKNYAVKSGSPCKEIQPSALVDPAENLFLSQSRHAPKKRVVNLSRESDEHQKPVLKVNEVKEVYETNHVSPKKGGKKRIFDSIEDVDLEESMEKPDDKDSSVSDNDENNCTPPTKRTKIKYNAANIGDETFKEESSISQLSDSSKKQSSSVKTRNIFAVTKSVKRNLTTISSTVEMKSKYFSNTPAKSNKPKDNESPSDKGSGNTSGLDKKGFSRESLASTKEVPKPVSLKDMFRNLKEKKALQEDEPLNKALPNKNSDDNRGNQQKTRTPSAFCWSKFKSNSSSVSVKPVKVASLSKSSGSTQNQRDSFSEMLSQNGSSSTNSHSNKTSCKSFLSLKHKSELEMKESPSVDSSAQVLEPETTSHSEVEELKSESYSSFLKSMASGGGGDKDVGDDSERDKSFKCTSEGESPFPDNGQETKLTSDVFVESGEDHGGSSQSQEGVIDLTTDSSQTSTVSEKSKSSNSSGRPLCRVSGLTRKRKASSKKGPGSTSESNQQSIKDLFSKFAFKRENHSGYASIPSSSSTDSVDDSLDLDEELEDTPRTKAIDMDSAALVRRKLEL